MLFLREGGLFAGPAPGFLGTRGANDASSEGTPSVLLCDGREAGRERPLLLAEGREDADTMMDGLALTVVLLPDTFLMTSNFGRLDI
ncbi:hypothetical protein D3C85_1547650 [compost metagenome]